MLATITSALDSEVWMRHAVGVLSAVLGQDDLPTRERRRQVRITNGPHDHAPVIGEADHLQDLVA